MTKLSISIVMLSAFGTFCLKAHGVRQSLVQPAICVSEESDVNRSPIAELIKNLFERYPDTESRATHREQFVTDIEEVISLTESKYLLDCKTARPDKYRFQISFMEPEKPSEMMSLATDYSTHPSVITLNFDLKIPTPYVLFTYMHELQHVCQWVESDNLFQDLRKQYNDLPKGLKTYVDTHTLADESELLLLQAREVNHYLRKQAARTQERYFNEIEAMYLMFREFRQLSLLNLELCEPGSRLAEVYKFSQLQLEKGQFAQQILSDYLMLSPSDEHKLLQLDTIERVYPTRFRKSPTFKLKLLKRELARKIETLGIKVIETSP